VTEDLRPGEDVDLRALAASGASAADVADAAEDALERGRVEAADLMGHLAHDLRGPLTGMLGLVQTMRRRSLPAEQVQEFLKRAESACRRMERLIADTTIVSLFETGVVHSRDEEVDVEQLLAEVSSAVGGDLSVELPAEVPTLLADHARIVQILERIVDQAHRMASTRPRILLRIAPGAMRFEVTAMGASSPPSEPPRLALWLTPEWRADGRGSGKLGMAVARELAELIGARLETSVGDEGATITLVVPVSN
jgi:signal transduction histidine kinase